MAEDAIAVLNAIGADTAHVMGCSMGGMIVQRLALDHTDRLLSLTSVMSRTGEQGYGDSSEEALAFLLAPAAPSRAAYIDRQVAALHVYGSKPEWLDDDAIRARAAAAYDRCFCPDGVGRQMKAVMRDGSRSAELAELDLPTLVIHGSRDTLIDPSGGRHTAEVIPGARDVEIDGMGHDYPHRSGRSGWRSGQSSPTPPWPGPDNRSACSARSPMRCFHSDAFAAMAAVSNRPAKYVQSSSARAIPMAP